MHVCVDGNVEKFAVSCWLWAYVYMDILLCKEAVPKVCMSNVDTSCIYVL